MFRGGWRAGWSPLSGASRTPCPWPSRLALPGFDSVFLGLTLMKSLPSLCLRFSSSLPGAGGRCLNTCTHTCTRKHTCAHTCTHTSVSTQLVSAPEDEEEPGGSLERGLCPEGPGQGVCRPHPLQCWQLPSGLADWPTAQPSLLRSLWPQRSFRVVSPLSRHGTAGLEPGRDLHFSFWAAPAQGDGQAPEGWVQSSPWSWDSCPKWVLGWQGLC